MIEEPGGAAGRVGADEGTAATCNGLGIVAATCNGLGSVEATDKRGSAEGLSGSDSPADVALAAICSAAGNGNTEATAASVNDTASAINSGWGGADGDDAAATCNDAGTADATAAVDIGAFAAAGATTLGSGTTELEGPGGTDKDASLTGECCIIWALESVPKFATCSVAESKECVCASWPCAEGSVWACAS